MKFILALALIFSFFIGSSAHAQLGDSRAVQAKREAGKFTAALLKKDYSGFVGLMYGPFVDSMGGTKMFTENVAASMKTAAKEGTYPESFSVGDAIDLATIGSQVAVTIPFELKLHEKGSATPISTTGFLIGISRDAGATWGFLDATKLSAPDILTFIPEFAGKLKIVQTSPTTH